MAIISAIAIAFVGLPIGALALFGSRLLFGWYLREVRRLRVAQEPADAIVTYPLA